MNNYEINKNTIAIIPINAEKTKVYEKNKNFYVFKNSIKIIKDSCNFFGSSYDGRVDGTKSMININSKVPIIIEEFNEIIFFPTSSPRLLTCCWISYNNVIKYIDLDGKTLIFFNDGTSLEIPISANIFDNQMTRALKLHMAIMERKKKLLA